MHDEMLALASFLLRGSTREIDGIEYCSEILLSTYDRDLIVTALRECASDALSYHSITEREKNPAK